MLVSPTEIIDPSSGSSLSLFPDVVGLFEVLAECRVPIGIASSSSATEVASRLLRSFGLTPLIRHAEVHAGRKEPHLRAIASKLRVPLNRIIFFDDLPHNIRDAERLGITSVHVQNGMTKSDLRCGLQRLGERRRGSALMSSWLKAVPQASTSGVSAPSTRQAGACLLSDTSSPTTVSNSEIGDSGSASGDVTSGQVV